MKHRLGAKPVVFELSISGREILAEIAALERPYQKGFWKDGSKRSPMTLQPWSFSTLAVLILLLLVALPTGQADNNFDFMDILRQSSQIATAAEDDPAKNRALQAVGQAQMDVLWAAVRALAAALDKAAEVERAQKTAATIPNEHQKDSALRDIAVPQAKTGDVKGALQTTAKIQHDRDTALERIAWAQAEGGDVKGALQTAM